MSDIPKDQGLWNAVFALLFLVLFAASFWWLTDGFETVYWFYTLSAFDITLIALATFRLIRLLSYDKIFTFVRNAFLTRQPDGTYKKEGGGPRRTVAELLECLWCTGLWAALAAVVLYLSGILGQFLVLVLAIAALGSLLQNLSHMLGRIGRHHE